MLTPQVFTSFDLGDPKQQKVFVNQVSQWLASLSAQVAALQALTTNFIALSDTVSQPGQGGYFNNLSVIYASPGNTITVTSATYISAPGPLLIMFWSPFGYAGSYSAITAVRQSDGARLTLCSNRGDYGASACCLNYLSNTQVGFQWGYASSAESGPPGLTVYAWQFAA